MKAYLGLGSNLGNRMQNMEVAVKFLSSDRNISISRLSRIRETKPYGKLDQADFLNQVIEIETKLSATELLTACQKVEDQLKRERLEKWGPRTIDIDILFYGNEIIEQEALRIPHPDLENRSFVMEPLNELSPDFVHPVLKKSVNQIYKDLKES